ncbi:site-specific integrase [Polluticoccus soli]|uniref:site-specific integrase n=1 Tax=Polluticoccus soli TaxID=3034150 RepID=UPI0023E2CE01|nr:site-specific integrase [Flavipsychrobacter sp. JY13-12]
MLSFKIILDKRYQKPDGTSPLKLRVYQGSNYKEKTLAMFINPEYWDEQQQQVRKKHKLAVNYNSNLTDLKSRVQKAILTSVDLPWVVTPSDIIRTTGNSLDNSRPTVPTYADSFITKLTMAGRVGNARAYRCAINQLTIFMEHKQYYFEQLTYKVLEDFKTSLLSKGIKPNSVASYLREIRALFNHAINEDVTELKHYPFHKVKIKGEKTVNRLLTPEQFAAMASYRLVVGTPSWHWRNMFLLSFCLVGINFADMLTLSEDNIQAGRIVYKRRKTGKLYSIYLHPEAERILSLYRGKQTATGLLLPVIKNPSDPVLLKKETLQACKTCSSHMKKLAGKCNINIPVSTYYARYTWANIAKGLGYSKDIIAEALGHEYGNRVTGIYLESYSNEEIDEANRNVISTVLK